MLQICIIKNFYVQFQSGCIYLHRVSTTRRWSADTCVTIERGIRSQRKLTRKTRKILICTILSILASDGKLDCPKENAISLLLQRELIEKVGANSYKFQVKLIRRLIIK